MHNKKLASEFEDAMDKLMLMQLMQRNNLQSLAKEYSKYEEKDVSVEEMKALIRKHFKSASTDERVALRYAMDSVSRIK